MNGSLDHYNTLATLFSYPDATYPDRVRQVQVLLDEKGTDAADELREFTEFTAGASRIELEELYTRSFDVQAVTTLDLGYVLFGDDYKRGQLLVSLNNEHQKAGIDCQNELPDHLPNVLRLLAVMEDAELRSELVERVVGPALRRIIGEFEPDRLEKKNKVYLKHHRTLIERSQHHGVIYQKTLKALYAVMEQDFDMGKDEPLVVPQQSRFLNSIGTEMNLERDKGSCHGPVK